MLLGLDIGSSSIKASLVTSSTGQTIATAQSPGTELEILSPQPGWAEQHPDTWWEHVLKALNTLKQHTGSLEKVKAIGISYQMHGLVIVDHQGTPLRPSIIWCDSRAAGYGQQAFEQLGSDYCLGRLLNNPGNFTAAKLAWVKHNEPDTFRRISKIMLPGDYIAWKLTGEMNTTVTGLSEGILWDFMANQPSEELLEHFGFDRKILPALVPGFGQQASVTRQVADLTSIPEGVPVTYRAGDQPNNALSLNVLNPGELAATAGTSGVIYGILNRVNHDPQSRVNIFAHVNHNQPDTRLGVLLCINGTGILYSWIKRLLEGCGLGYQEMNVAASQASPGSDGLMIFPFGNGVERIHQNRPFGGRVEGLDFNRHLRQHLVRAAQEGIVYALNYGFEAMKEMGVRAETVKAGHANLFLSPLFRQIFAAVTNTTVEIYDTDGATGAARGAGIGAGIFSTPTEAFQSLQVLDRVKPDEQLHEIYSNEYKKWVERMTNILGDA